MTTPLTKLLKTHEGSKKDPHGRHLPYQDSVGKWTIGYGRNLSDVGLSDEEAEVLLLDDISRVQRELDEALPWWRDLDPVRQAVMIDLGFNLGVLTPPGKAKLLDFTGTLAYIRTRQFEKAVGNLRKTPWHTQVGSRAEDLEWMLVTGNWPPFIGSTVQ